MANVTLKNRTNRTKVIVLDHPAFRTKESGFRRTVQTVIDQAKDGGKKPRTVTRQEPGSITLPPRGSVEDLHPAIKNCAQVRSLLARGEVEIVPFAAKSSGPPPKARHARPSRAESKKGEG